MKKKGKIINLKLVALFIIALQFYYNLSYCQNQIQIDSIVKEIGKIPDDTNKIKLLYNLSSNYYAINPDTGIKYGLQALNLSEQINWEKGTCISNNKIGINYWAKANYSKALVYQYKALEIENELKDDNIKAMILGNIGLIYGDQDELEKALDYEQQALNIYYKLKDKHGILKNLCNIGTLYNSIANYPKALENYYNALKISEELDDKKNIAINLNNIGDAYQFQHNLPKALEYEMKALKNFEELGDKNNLAWIQRNIGQLYRLNLNFDSAIIFCDYADKIFEELKDKRGLGITLGDLGVIYQTQKKFSTALDYFFLALKNYKELDAKSGVSLSLGNIGNTFLDLYKCDTIKSIFYFNKTIPKNKFIDSAINYLNKSILISTEINDENSLIDFSLALSESYEVSKKFKNAYINYVNYVNVKNSVFSLQNKMLIANLETQRDIDIKNKDIEIKDKQILIDKLDIQKKQNERVYFIIGILILLILIVFIAISIKNQKNSNDLLVIEKKKSEDLLLNILPKEVANELKEKGSADACFFENVTVMFTDFKGSIHFENSSPYQFVDELNNCFKAFDTILSKYNIEKIKTVGTTYLAVAGLPTHNANHAYDMMNAALEIMEFMQNRKKELGNITFDISIGMNSGSLVAGIVGVKKFAYDIWGDTVNIAARMMHNCEVNKINISSSAYEILKDNYKFEYRGEIDAKNKGKLKMYFWVSDSI